MEVRYKRESKRNFLVVEPDPGARTGYESRMMLENDIEGLLRFHAKYMDERQVYYYDITSMQPLTRMMEGRWMRKEEVCRLFLRLDGVLNRMGEYLLDGDLLLLDPDYIYTDPQWSQLQFCLVPGMDGNFQESLSRLLQYILKKTDHRDKEGVVLSYGLYQESLKENYGMDNLLSLIYKAQRMDESSREQAEGWEQAGSRGEADSLDQTGGRGRTGEEVRWTEPTKPDGALLKRPEKGKTGRTGPALWVGLIQAAAFCLGAEAVFAAALWLLGGLEALRRWGVIGGAILLAVLAAAFAVRILLEKKKGPKENMAGSHPLGQNGQRQEERGRWEITDEEESESRYQPQGEEVTGIRYQMQAEDAARSRYQPQEQGKNSVDHYAMPFKTVPLSNMEEEEEEIHYLQPMMGGRERIEIRYFPFVIGKQEELVDYFLDEETVSRLHVRLDREQDQCRITDLNSTNGTSVNGKQLEANETTNLGPGDEVIIAEIAYIFH